MKKTNKITLTVTVYLKDKVKPSTESITTLCEEVGNAILNKDYQTGFCFGTPITPKAFEVKCPDSIKSGEWYKETE